MVKSIEARAVISATDKTGGVFDKLAQKIRGVEKSAKDLGNIKAPKFTGNIQDELRKLKLTEKELLDSRTRQAKMMETIRGAKAEHFFRAQRDWMDKELDHWRKVKSNINEAAVAHKRWRSAIVAGGSMVAGGAAFAAGGAYGAYRIGKAGVRAAAEGQRESARDFGAGISDPNSKKLANAALEGANRFKSVDSQMMHATLREASSSMRSVDKAVSLTDTFGEMLTVLQSMKGKDRAVAELRQFMSSLDVLGRNQDPAQVRSLGEAFVKAAGVEGADFDLGRMLATAKQLKSAGATVSDRFLATTGVSLGRDMGDEKAGNAIAMMNQQEVQATKAAKSYGVEAGLRDRKTGMFVDRGLLQSDPDLWLWKHAPEAMRRKKLDPNNNEDVNTFLNSFYSNQSARNAGSKILTQGDQYKAMAQAYGRVPDLDKLAKELPKRDPFVALEGVNAQLRTLAGQAPIMDAAAAGLNSISDAIVNMNKTIQTGEVPLDSRGGRMLRWMQEKGLPTGTKYWPQAEDPMGKDSDYRSWSERRPDAVPYPMGDDPMGKDYSRYQAHQPGYWYGLGREGASASSAARLQREAEWRKSREVSAPAISQTMTWGTGLQNQANIEKSAEIKVDGEVHGEMVGTFRFIVDSSGLVSAVNQMERLSADIAGKLSKLGGNGPGSTGKSSPDAQAP